VIAQFEIRDPADTLLVPSQNLSALEEDVSRQFVTTMSSHGRAGPKRSVE
jgi:hypothetical protein